MSQARQVAGAVAVGAAAGGLVILDVRIILVTTVALAAVLVLARFVLRGRHVAVAAWGCAALTAPLNGVRISGSVALSDIFLVLAVAAMLPSLVVRNRTSPAPLTNAVLVGLAMITAGGLVGTAFAVRPEASLLEMAKFIVSAAGSVVAMRLWGPDGRAVRWFCSLWLTGAVASALWALTLSVKVAGRPVGLATSPNHLGIVCLLATAVALGLVLCGQPVARWLSLVVLPPLVLALVASGSRAALLGFFVMVPTVAVLASRVQLAVRAAAAASVFAVAVLTGVVQVPGGTALGRLLGDRTSAESNTERLGQLGKSFDRFEEHPLTGEGFEFAQEAHNIYLQVLAAAGPLGLIGFVIVAWSVLRAAKTGARAGPRRVTGDHALLSGLGGGYVGYLVAGLFQNILWDRYLWLYVAAILALATSLPRVHPGRFGASGGADDPPGPPERPPAGRRESGSAGIRSARAARLVR